MFQEFPKWVRREGKPSQICDTPEAEAELLAKWDAEDGPAPSPEPEPAPPVNEPVAQNPDQQQPAPKRRGRPPKARH